MHLISINAWGGNLSEALTAYPAANARPDILLLQEVTWAVDPTPERVFFKEHGFDLLQHTDLFAELCRAAARPSGLFLSVFARRRY